MKQITLILAEDHIVVREGLRLLLETECGFKVIAEARTGREAVTLAKLHQPEVVLMDIAMPNLNGIEAMRQILKAAPAARVLILSAHDDDAYVDHALEAGAAGFVVKQSSCADLARAITNVVRGATYLSSGIARRLDKRTRSAPNHAGSLKPINSKLSSRESETLQLIAEGMANKQIASELHISVKTVEKHRQHLMDKLNIHDIAGLTRYALSEGIIDCLTPDRKPGL